MPVPVDVFLQIVLDFLEIIQWQLPIEETILLFSSLISSGMVLATGMFYLRGDQTASPLEDGPESAVLSTHPSESYHGSSRDMARLLLQREILGYALTRIFETEAEGNLSPAERENLISRYEGDLKKVNENIGRLDKFAKLDALEREKENLSDMVGGRLKKVESKIHDLKIELGVEEKPEPKPKKKAKKKPKRKVSKEKSELQEFMEEMATVLQEMEKIDKEE
jgi:hypothetical protein